MRDATQTACQRHIRSRLPAQQGKPGSKLAHTAAPLFFGPPLKPQKDTAELTAKR
jgi:hypothetical protein